MSQKSKCLHCTSEMNIEGLFCCVGCKSAYEITKDSMTNDCKKLYFAYFAIEGKNGENSIILSVDGMHCAACISKIESVLLAKKYVTSARVNMSTNRLSISWEGEKKNADELASLVVALGYGVEPFNESKNSKKIADEESYLLRCLAVAGFASVNLMMIVTGLWFPVEVMEISIKDYFNILSALIALPSAIYSGRPFFFSAYNAVKAKNINMDVPITLAIVLTSCMSVYEAINHSNHVYFDSVVMLIFFLLIGRYLDAKSKNKARKSALEILSRLAGVVTIIENKKHLTIPIKDIRQDMVVFVVAGDKISVDGVVIKGQSDVDFSLITGESLPKNIKKGDDVYAGTINLSSSLYIKVSKATKDNLLSNIVEIMEVAAQSQAKYVRLADKAAKLYTKLVHAVSALTFFGWYVLVGVSWQESLIYSVAVLIITCPCALGLAVPVVQVLASSKLMKLGILLKGSDALEKLSKIDVAIFDKTGTLTFGKPELLEEQYAEEDLKIAASIAANSKHPLSFAISKAYKGKLFKAKNIVEYAGKGIEAEINNKIYKLGSQKWCGNSVKESSSNKYELCLKTEGQDAARFYFFDQLRPDAADVIAFLDKSNIKTVLLSGDRLETVQYVAAKIGINEYHALLSPIEKYNYIDKLQKSGLKVLMVGDGLNDAAAIAQADVSISPSTAIDITQNAASIIFQGEKLWQVINAWNVAKYSILLVKQNFALALLYNLIAIPLAVFGFVTPLIASIAMSLSSLVVIGNSFRINFNKDL